MTLTQIEYLVAVDKHRHFGKAAQACHVSQPTLSMQLRKLEEELGVTFFDRSKQPVLVLPEARAILEQAKAVLSEARKLEYLGREREHSPGGPFRLALIPTIAPYLIPRFLGTFAGRYARVDLSIEEMTTAQIVEALEREELDGAILATPLRRPSLIERPLYYEPFQVWASLDHPIARKERVAEADLDCDVWLLSEGHCLRNQVARVCSLKRSAGIFANVHFESGNLQTLLELVGKGHGYTLVPLLAALAQPAAERRRFARPFTRPEPTREVSLVYRRAQYKAAVIEALVDTVLENLPEELPTAKGKGLHVVRV